MKDEASCELRSGGQEGGLLGCSFPEVLFAMIQDGED